jgi:branched-chain amino acid transport system ATP-binding protein
VEASRPEQGLPLLTAIERDAETEVAYAPLALHDVHAGYGRIEVLRGVDIAVARGGVTALLGPNGAGKTTTLHVMSGLITPWSGCRHVEGRHVNGAGADELARIGVCHIREGRSVFPNLTVDDNLVVAASAGASIDRVRDVAFTLFPRLEERRTQVAGTLSGGEQQMLALARGLGTDPAVLLVDELSMGLAPLIVTELYEAVAAIAQTGVSVLVVEQFATIGLRYASMVYVMAHGTVTYSGATEGAEDAVHAAYLGGEKTR